MNDDLNEKKSDEMELGKLKNNLKTLSKKTKNLFKMIYRAIIAAPVVIKLALILALVVAVVVVINAFVELLNFFGTNNVSALAARAVIQNEITISEASDPDKGYYFKINGDIVEIFKEELNKAYESGAYDDVDIDADDDDETGNRNEIEDDDEEDEDESEDEDDDEEEDEDEEDNTDEDDDEDTGNVIKDEDELEYNEDDLMYIFQTDDKDVMKAYIIKMIRAEIASSYPRLGSYEGEGTGDSQGNKKDREGNYVAQGVVQIKRKKINKDGTPNGDAITLNYLPHEKFTELVNSNNSDALNYFSFEQGKGLLYYATYKETVKNVNGSDTETVFTIQENNVSYRTLTTMTGMPYNFLFALLQESQNPEWVMAVIDLMWKQENEVVLMIQDQINESEYTEVNKQAQRTDKTQYTSQEGNSYYVQSEKYDITEDAIKNVEADKKVVDFLSNISTNGTKRVYSKTRSLRGSQEKVQSEDILRITHDGNAYEYKVFLIGDNTSGTSNRSVESGPSYEWAEGDKESTYKFPSEFGETENVISKSYTNTSNVFIQKAKTWCIDFEQEIEGTEPTKVENQGEEKTYEYKTLANGEVDSTSYYSVDDLKELTYTLYSENSGSIPSASQGGSAELEEIYLSNEKLLYSSKLNTVTYTWNVKILNEKKLDPNKFLGLWKNAEGKYDKNGENLFDPNGKDVGYRMPPPEETVIAYPVEAITTTSAEDDIDELIELLEMHEDTQVHAQIMMYFWNIYYGENVYDVDPNSILNLFNTNLISLNGTDTPSNLLREYIRSWEHASPPPTNADGTCYIIETDGYDNPTVGYGIDIFNGGYESLFLSSGYSTEIGGEVPIEFVDALEEQEIKGCEDAIRGLTAGLDLKEYQIHALVSRAYNAGTGSLSSTDHPGAVGIRNGKNFIQAYEAYWNAETDDLFESHVTEGNYNHNLYTNYMNKPNTAKTSEGPKYSAGLDNRRKSEWTLFQAGYYTTLGKWYLEGNDRILSIADTIHKWMETNNYTYCVYNSNSYEECSGEAHGLNTTFEASKTGYHHSCCATFVSWVLQEGGYLEDSEHQDGAGDLKDKLISKGWQVINNVDDLKPGDVLYYSGHVEIYAGDNKVYNAGSGRAIRGASPAGSGRGISNMVMALRPN